MNSDIERAYVPVLHAGREDRPDEIDTVHAAEIVAATLSSLGFRSEVIRTGLDLHKLHDLAARKPACVFNLVDGIDGDDSLIGLVPAVLEHLGVPFTGCGVEAFNLTLSKCRTKQMLRHLDLPTADWSEDGANCKPQNRYIVKSDTYHGSRGMDEKSVVTGSEASREIAMRADQYGGRFFCEEFIDGREFNVALIGSADSVKVLPIQEIDFAGFPEDRAQIVDYAAKWDGSDAAYHTTNRRFGLELREPALAQKLVTISETVWRAFGLKGYARVDFRVNGATPYILEINANPALAPDAGFAAAAAEGGIAYGPLLEKVISLAGQSFIDDAACSPSKIRQQPSSALSLKSLPQLHWRDEVVPADEEAIAELVKATGYFTEDEVDIAAELVRERLTNGTASGYEFIIAELDNRIVGYACFGKIDGTEAAFDLYWIAVDPACQGKGIGRQIMRKAEQLMSAMGAQSVYVDTSSSEKYTSTRAFYNSMGYHEQARLIDFYRRGDSKVIFVGYLPPAVMTAQLQGQIS